MTREQLSLRIGAACLVVSSPIVLVDRAVLHGDLPTDAGKTALSFVAGRPDYPSSTWSIGSGSLSGLWGSSRSRAPWRTVLPGRSRPPGGCERARGRGRPHRRVLRRRLRPAGPRAGFDRGQYPDRSSFVRAVVDMFGGPADFNESGDSSGFARAVFWLTFGHSASARRSASPLTYVGPHALPFLIFQGTDDATLPPRNARELAGRLEAAGTPVTLVMVGGAGHGLDAPGEEPSEETLVKTVASFFGRTLAQDPARGPTPAAPKGLVGRFSASPSGGGSESRSTFRAPAVTRDAPDGTLRGPPRGVGYPARVSGVRIRRAPASRSATADGIAKNLERGADFAGTRSS